MLPPYLNYPKPPPAEVFQLEYEGTILKSFPGGDLRIIGNPHKAAKAIFNFMLEHREKHRNVMEMYQLKGLYYNNFGMVWYDQFDIYYAPFVGTGYVPPDYTKLKEEFDKLKKLMVFI